MADVATIGAYVAAAVGMIGGLASLVRLGADIARPSPATPPAPRETQLPSAPALPARDAEVEGLRRELDRLRAEVEGLRHDVEGLRRDVDELRADAKAALVKRQKRDERQAILLALIAQRLKVSVPEAPIGGERDSEG